MSNETRGTLRNGEPHPAAYSAMGYVKGCIATPERTAILLESLASCAIEGNRMAEICNETLRRVLRGEPVSDRYLLGLAWFIKTSVFINTPVDIREMIVIEEANPK